MLTQLSIRFPDRVPKEDHDKILKDHFFYDIRSDICNSICHLYDDETVTFSQLLVKAHRNEEEETTSKLVNKSAVADSTLQERVDRLIKKSNQSNQPNPGPSRVIGIIVIVMGGPPFNKTKGLGVTFVILPISHQVILGKT